KPGVYTLPAALDDKIAQLQLDSMGVKIDKLSKRQAEYLSGWQEGTGLFTVNQFLNGTQGQVT
ncbi:MAG TPA: adenosylhomocysteinase, partial [Candidatus Gracilibacteria bacterium]|nr:adenosylhomocysteinase [Candidatus Gracilibacteria bacterium]